MPRAKASTPPKNVRTPLGDFLDDQYIAWRDQQKGKRGSFSKWAKEVVKIDRVVLGHYINRGSIPDEENLSTLAALYGDVVYQLAGALPPDPRLKRIIDNWLQVPDATKTELAELADRAAARAEIGAGGGRVGISN